jgi:pimeloyl-ACP methyl ester carboxylesterase
MRRAAGLQGSVLILGLLLLTAAAGARAEGLSIATRPGVTVAVDLRLPEGATALVLLFEGGGGKLGTDFQGFAHLAHGRLDGKGIASALVDAPSDQRDFRGGMHPAFRTSQEHLQDIDAVVTALRARTSLPLWLLGISQGSRTAAWYAASRPDAIEGVVLLSSLTDDPRSLQVTSFPLHNIRAPLLALAHDDDSCPGTPPAGAQRIVAAATASLGVEVKRFTGGKSVGSRPCGTRTHHTFFGIEDTVIATIATYIAAHTR